MTMICACFDTDWHEYLCIQKGHQITIFYSVESLIPCTLDKILGRTKMNVLNEPNRYFG